MKDYSDRQIWILSVRHLFSSRLSGLSFCFSFCFYFFLFFFLTWSLLLCLDTPLESTSPAVDVGFWSGWMLFSSFMVIDHCLTFFFFLLFWSSLLFLVGWRGCFGGVYIFLSSPSFLSFSSSIGSWVLSSSLLLSSPFFSFFFSLFFFLFEASRMEIFKYLISSPTTDI